VGTKQEKSHKKKSRRNLKKKGGKGEREMGEYKSTCEFEEEGSPATPAMNAKGFLFV
jgi:hypothetical protein